MSLKTDCLALCTLVNLKRRAKYYQLAYNKYSEQAIQRMFRELAHEGYVSTPHVPEAVLTPAGKQKLATLVYRKVKEGKWTPKTEEQNNEGTTLVSSGSDDRGSSSICNSGN